MKKLYLVVSTVVLWMAFLSLSAFAQFTDATQDQTPPQPGTGYDYLGGQIYTIDPQQGTLSVRIAPVLAYGRGIMPEFAVEYDSNGAHHAVGGATGPTFWDNSGYTATAGWSYMVPKLTIYQKTQLSDDSGTQVVCVFYTNYVFQDMQGGTHNLGGPTNCPSGPAATTPYISGTSPVNGAVTAVLQEADGTINHMPQPVTVSDSNGNVYYFSGSCHTEWNNSMGCMASSVEDRNGNVIYFNDSAQTPGAFTVTDTIGRTILTSNGFGASGNTISIANMGQPFQITWGSANYNWPFTEQVTSSPGCNPGPNPLSGSANVITQLTLPNGLFYNFTYDSVTGLLNQITYPNGNTATFTWGNAPLGGTTTYSDQYQGITYQCAALMDTPAIMKEVISANGATVLERDYTYATPGWQLQGQAYAWTAKTTTVVTKDVLRGNSAQTVYTYAGPAGGNNVQFSRQSTIQNYDFGGKLLRTQVKTWEFAQQQPSITTTTLDNGQTSEVISCFQGYNWLPGSLQPCPANTNPSDSSNGLTTDTFTYDYGSGAPGTLLTHKQWIYPTNPIFTPIGGVILDTPQKSILYDGNGNRMAETDFAYDQYGPSGIAAVTTTAHDDASFGNAAIARGNVTSSTKVCFVPATGATCENSVTSYSYDQTGQVVSAADTYGNATQYGYSDNYNSVQQPAGNTNAFVTAITRPTTQNGIAHVSHYSYDYLSGYLTTAKDENGNTTTYKYNDPGHLDRLTETDHPDQGKVTLTYNDAGTNPNVVTTTTINSSQSEIATAIMDGLGHKVHSQLNSDPQGVDTTDTAYDGFGEVWTLSNPHRSTSSPTDGTSTYTYDALGRKIQTKEQDGSLTSTAYTGSQTTVTDEVGNQRRSIADALGRLIEVDEPGDPQPATPATGSLGISGNGLKSYTYAATDSTGSFTIIGTEQSKVYYVGAQNTPTTVYDQGTISLTVNGCSSGNVTYAQASTASSLATSLAGQLNGSCGSYATASANGAVISLLSKTGGTAGNYSLSGTSATTVTQGPYGQPGFSGPSFVSTPSGSTLAGGSNSSTTYDYGTLRVTVGGWTSPSVAYGSNGNNGGNNTSALVVAALNTALNTPGSPVAARISGGSIVLTEQTPGSAANGTQVSVTSTSGDSTLFGSGTYGGAAIMLGGGWNGGSTLAVPYVTLYQYDAVGNLVCVEQHGNATTGTGCASYPTPTQNDPWRPRMFTYDSLGHLLSTYNPESGLTDYAYDANGNVVTKTDARGIVVTNSYDQLNRPISTAYSDGTACESFFYDLSSYASHAISNAVGRRVAAVSGNGASDITSYDSMGRVATTWQCIPGVSVCQAFAASQYNYLGGIQQLTYSNGLALTYGYDSAGRQTQISDSNGISYAQGVAYTPNGAIQQLSAPNFKYTWSLNNRMQPAEISVGNTANTLFDKKYVYGAANNGNIASITNVKNNTRSQSFTYDSVNRLTSAHDNGNWSDTYTYDPWGNLTAMTPGMPTGEPFSSSANANNRLNTLQYDLAGNVTNDGAHAYTFDADSHIVGVDSNLSYTYDADGKRISKSTGTNYWYGPDGSPLAESDNSGNWTNYIFFGSQRLARSDASGIDYYVMDHLHSTNMFVTASGSVLDDQDYNPFGLAVTVVGSFTSNNHFKCSSKERDTETGLDYYGARFYGSSMGRFMTPDWALSPISVPHAKFGDPQSLNQYGYDDNNPIDNLDPDGHQKEELEVLWMNFKDNSKTGLNRLFSRGTAKGLVTTGVGVAKIAIATTAEVGTGGASTALSAYGIISGTGNVASGLSQIFGTLSGQSEEGEKVSNGIAIASSIPAIITLAVTHGNVDDASFTASAETLFTTGAQVGGGATSGMETVEKATTAVDTANAGEDIYFFLKQPDKNSGEKAKEDKKKQAVE